MGTPLPPNQTSYVSNFSDTHPENVGNVTRAFSSYLSSDKNTLSFENCIVFGSIDDEDLGTPDNPKTPPYDTIKKPYFELFPTGLGKKVRVSPGKCLINGIMVEINQPVLLSIDSEASFSTGQDFDEFNRDIASDGTYYIGIYIILDRRITNQLNAVVKFIYEKAYSQIAIQTSDDSLYDPNTIFGNTFEDVVCCLGVAQYQIGGNGTTHQMDVLSINPNDSSVYRQILQLVVDGGWIGTPDPKPENAKFMK